MKTEYGEPGRALARWQEREHNEAASVGIVGEQRTAEMLRSIARERPSEDRFTVLHSLAIPGTRSLDVDHVVVARDRIVLVDSKVWKPLRYVTIGSTFAVRGWRWHRYLPADKRGLLAARSALADYLRSHHRAPKFEALVMVVWGLQEGTSPKLGLYRPAKGVQAWPASVARQQLSRRIPHGAADPMLVEALRALCIP